MLVKDYMTRHPIMIPPTLPAPEAQKIMVENKVRHLPVVGDGKRPLGLITRERLRITPADLTSLNVWEITRFLSNMTVKDLMVAGKDLVTISPDAALEEAAQVMAKKKIGCLPVVEDDVVVGVLTETDMLVQLADLLMPDKIGGFAKVTTAIAQKGWGIYASGSVPAPRRAGYWDMILKVHNVSTDEVVSLLEPLDDVEIVDVREM
jgi:acetoin utilization protein AcuB